MLMSILSCPKLDSRQGITQSKQQSLTRVSNFGSCFISKNRQRTLIVTPSSVYVASTFLGITKIFRARAYCRCVPRHCSAHGLLRNCSENVAKKARIQRPKYISWLKDYSLCEPRFPRNISAL